MGLGETKRRDRLVGSAITKNSAWTNDASLPGQRLLSSMGWSQGQGLGTSSQGTAIPITMAFKLDNKGIGAKRFEKEARASGKTDAWIGGGGELGDLFERLNKGRGAVAAPIPVESDVVIGEAEEGEKKSKKGKGKAKVVEDTVKPKDERKDKKRKAKEDKVEIVDPVVVEEAIEKVASTLPHRMAHRARFLRAKRMVGADLASVNEILGISSASLNSPVPSVISPSPVIAEVPEKAEMVEQSEKGKGKRKRSEGTAEEYVSDDKKARREAKRIAKEAKRERKEKKRKGKLQNQDDEEESKDEEKEVLKVPMEPSSDPSFKAGGGMKVSSLSVQDYLQNKLMKRRAALVRQRREAAANEEASLWKRAAMVSA
ncbi:hypothetical protein CBS101457_005654 [Exobasidium rhododendri]|nr:hypothetical protein CBS101457_005654 [Exobasidium rhododendri]